MGIEIALLVVAGIGVGLQAKGQADARKANKQARRVQAAQNAAESARERRQQIREERVRRAQILQASENFGTVGSAGETGSVAALSTNLNANIGTNLGRLQSANQLSIFEQKAADAQFMANMGQLLTSTASTFASAGSSGSK